MPLLAFYLSFVSTITLIARIPTVKAQYELVVFWTYNAIQNGRTDLKQEIFWNVVLFIPIGILVSLLFSKRKAFIALVLSMFMSCSIEIIQLVLHRGLFEFDDIIHNSLGAFIGILVCLLVRLIAGKVLPEK